MLYAHVHNSNCAFTCTMYDVWNYVLTIACPHCTNHRIAGIFHGFFGGWHYSCVIEVIDGLNFRGTRSFPVGNMCGLTLLHLFAGLLFVEGSQLRKLRIIIPHEKYPLYGI